DPGLLQHDLADPDRIRITRPPPRQIAPHPREVTDHRRRDLPMSAHALSYPGRRAIATESARTPSCAIGASRPWAPLSRRPGRERLTSAFGHGGTISFQSLADTLGSRRSARSLVTRTAPSQTA